MAVYSGKRNYLFLASPQTGSKAIAKTLLDKLDGQQVPEKGVMREGKIIVSKHHTTVKMLLQHELLTKEQVQKAFKFCGVRNPFDLQVSRYLKLRGRNIESGKISGHIQKNERALEVVTLAGEMDFPEWLHKAHARHIENDKQIMAPMLFVTSVDHVIRFAAIEAGFREALQRMGVTEEVSLVEHNVTSQRLDSGKKRDYREFYDDASIALVQKLYAPLIEHFGYRFDPA